METNFFDAIASFSNFVVEQIIADPILLVPFLAIGCCCLVISACLFLS